MSGQDLGDRTAIAVISTNGTNPFGNGFWVSTFDQRVFALSTNAFEVYRITLMGPAGSKMLVYRDKTRVEIVPRGDLNSWNPPQPIQMRGGQTLYFYWNSGAATVPAPDVTIFLRKPSVI